MYGWRSRVVAAAEGFSIAFLVVSLADFVALAAPSVKDLEAILFCCNERVSTINDKCDIYFSD